MPSPRPLPLIKCQKARPDLRKARQGNFSGTKSRFSLDESLAFGQFTTQDLLQSGHLPHKNSKNLLGPTHPIFFEINQGRPRPSREHHFGVDATRHGGRAPAGNLVCNGDRPSVQVSWAISRWRRSSCPSVLGAGHQCPVLRPQCDARSHHRSDSAAGGQCLCRMLPLPGTPRFLKKQRLECR